jgi:hypothetical protein
VKMSTEKSKRMEDGPVQRLVPTASISSCPWNMPMRTREEESYECLTSDSSTSTKEEPGAPNSPLHSSFLLSLLTSSTMGLVSCLAGYDCSTHCNPAGYSDRESPMKGAKARYRSRNVSDRSQPSFWHGKGYSPDCHASPVSR